jgi:hypothetical protein
MLPVSIWTPSQFGSAYQVSLHTSGQKFALKQIGNFLGEYITTNMGFLASGEMVVARILVSLNIGKG